MDLISCPYLGGTVELSERREQHIAEAHPDLLPEHRNCIIKALQDPDLVRRSTRMANARLFSRWFEDLHGGKFGVVVVVSDVFPPGRHWVITAYVASKTPEKGVLWKRS